MKILFSLIVAIISLNGIAQKTKHQLYVTPQVALLNGAQTADAQIQMVMGFKNNKWSLGIGSGIDYYILRSVPLFIDARRFATIKQKNLFVYANAGMNIVWPTDKERANNWNRIGGGASSSSFYNGIYTDIGIGILLGKKNNLQASIGYSTKTFSETYQEWPVIWPVPITVTPTDRRLSYTLNRIVLRVGITL